MSRGPDPPPRTRRLFIAVGLPDDVQDVLDRRVAAARERLPGVRWTPRANRHITIRFLGAVPAGFEEQVAAATRAAARASAPFALTLGEPGRFPERGRARVLWVGLTDPAGALPSLAAAVEAAIPSAFDPETRPFRAHLTVARADPPADPGAWLGIPSDPVAWNARDLLLVESHLGRPHSRYEIRGRFPLGHVAADRPDPR